MSGCCGDDCSYEILSRRTKHGEASAGHTHGGGHCGGCCHWAASATPFYDWFKSQQLSWLCVKAWAACFSASVLEFEPMVEYLPTDKRRCIMDWDLCWGFVLFCFFGVFLPQKQYAVWAFTHGSGFSFPTFWFRVQILFLVLFYQFII